MSFPEIPADVVAKVKRLFRSENRKKIANELLFFSYWPSTDEKQSIADRYEMHVTSIDKILYKLRDNDLFTKEQGSIPLYRTKLQEEVATIPREEGIEELEVTEEHTPIIEPELDERKSELEENRMNSLEAQVHSVGERLDGFMAEIRSAMHQLSVDPPKNNPDPVEPPNNPSNPTVEEPNTLNPFSNMSGNQIYEMLINQPREFMEMMGIQNRPAQGNIQAVPVTVRKVIVDVTTYTLTCYEKAVNDGAFDGTFSDFMNQCVYKYFEDRGLALGWHKLEKFGRYPA